MFQTAASICEINLITYHFIPSSECAKPLGLENNRIPNSAITASSEVKESVTLIISFLFFCVKIVFVTCLRESHLRKRDIGRKSFKSLW